MTPGGGWNHALIDAFESIAGVPSPPMRGIHRTRAYRVRPDRHLDLSDLYFLRCKPG